ncbi:MAG: PUR family DNA/RNA-binding protein [Marinilabiliaceae bacterium]|nr:PUR family DNA/RNA-binding protein [Marinilabiliaceae bacterium]
MEGFEKNEGFEQTERDEIFSKAVRAGKRTYFFDVKATRKNDYYLTITESKKRFEQDGRFHFEKHKVFLYKEDFEKFSDGLQEVIDYIKSAQLENAEVDYTEEPVSATEYSNVEFEDLNQ